jgi:hypothetical protein
MYLGLKLYIFMLKVTIYLDLRLKFVFGLELESFLI